MGMDRREFLSLIVAAAVSPVAKPSRAADGTILDWQRFPDTGSFHMAGELPPIALTFQGVKRFPFQSNAAIIEAGRIRNYALNVARCRELGISIPPGPYAFLANTKATT
jgi:hypothetical protein